MTSRNSAVSIFTITAICLLCSNSIFAGKVRKYSGNFDLAIPTKPGETSGPMEDAVIYIDDNFTIEDLDIALNIKHPHTFDLQIFLQSPAGTEICLNQYGKDDYFEGADYTDTTFDDEAEISIEDATAPFTGKFKPKLNYSLSVFDGESTHGDWRLRINDNYFSHTGTLKKVELIMTVPEPASILLLGFGAAIFSKLRNYESQMLRG